MSPALLNSGNCLEQLRTSQQYTENERHFINHCRNVASFPLWPHLLKSLFFQFQENSLQRPEHRDHDTIRSCESQKFKKKEKKLTGGTCEDKTETLMRGRLDECFKYKGKIISSFCRHCSHLITVPFQAWDVTGSSTTGSAKVKELSLLDYTDIFSFIASSRW